MVTSRDENQLRNQEDHSDADSSPLSDEDALLAAVVELSQDLELRPLLERFVETAIALTNAQYGALGILNASGTFDDLVLSGIDEETAARIGDGPHGKGVLGAIIHTPHTLRVPDISQHPESVGFPDGHPPMDSFLGCPVVIRGAVYGNIYLTNKQGAEQFTARDERVLEALASAAASAIAHARTLARVEARERWARAAAEGVEVLAQLPARDAWPAVVERFDSILTAAHVEHIPPHRLPGRFGTDLPDLADDLAEHQIPRYFEENEATSMCGRPMGCALVVPVAAGEHSAGALLFAWEPHRVSLDPEALVDIGQIVGDRLTVASLLAAQNAERERIAILEDRDRIAQDLHDHVIQRLFAAGMRVQSALAITTKSDVAERLDAVVTDLDEVVQDVRRTIFELHEGNAALALAHSIERVAAEARDALGFEPSVSVTGDYWTLEDPLVADVLAVAREALSNAARHAKARSVRILVDVSETVCVRVTDDGIGLPEQLPHRSGLAHLDARAERWGGECRISPRRSGGTSVMWQVPRRRSALG